MSASPDRPGASVAREAEAITFVMCLIVGLGFIGLGAPLMIVFFPWNLGKDLRLSWGKRAEANGAIIREAETDVSVNDVTVYRYEFRFTDAQGREWTGACHKSGAGGLPQPAGAAEYQPGRVRVQYLPGNPRVCRIAGCRLSLCPVPAGFVVIFPLVGFGLLLYAFRARRRPSIKTSRGIRRRGKGIRNH